ncbi:hypothetical protein [Methylomonas sp. WH-1]
MYIKKYKLPFVIFCPVEIFSAPPSQTTKGRYKMSEVQEKDNFWLYIVIAVVLAAGAVLMVKNAEHDKYATAAKNIAEDSANSAYRNDVLHSGGTKR